MDFTREPIIETIITPKDGCKLVIRSSKGAGAEEFFVDAIEVVSFGQGLFFRSLERPKSFLVPIADYEVVEVREARMVLKNVSTERSSIKIGGGRESGNKTYRESEKIETPAPMISEEEEVSVNAEEGAEGSTESRPDLRLDKKRDRRRHYRKRRNGKEEPGKEEGSGQENSLPQLEEGGKVSIPLPQEGAEKIEAGAAAALTSNLLSSLLQPPPTLISETINRYRENALFKSAFFLTEEEQYKPHSKANELLNEEEELSLDRTEDGTSGPQGEENNTENQPLLSESELDLADTEELFDSERESTEAEGLSESILPEIEEEQLNLVGFSTEEAEMPIKMAIGIEEISVPVKKKGERGSSRRKQEEEPVEVRQEQVEELHLPLFAEDGFNGIIHREENPFPVIHIESQKEEEEEPKVWQENTPKVD